MGWRDHLRMCICIWFFISSHEANVQAEKPDFSVESQPTNEPTSLPTSSLFGVPTIEPSTSPTSIAGSKPTAEPSSPPTFVGFGPTSEPTSKPTVDDAPTPEPTSKPTSLIDIGLSAPTLEPTGKPTLHEVVSNSEKKKQSKASMYPDLADEETRDDDMKEDMTKFIQLLQKPVQEVTSSTTPESQILYSHDIVYNFKSQLNETESKSDNPPESFVQYAMSKRELQDTDEPTQEPTAEPTKEPSSRPSESSVPSTVPSKSAAPTISSQPSSLPSCAPSAAPSAFPSSSGPICSDSVTWSLGILDGVDQNCGWVYLNPSVRCVLSVDGVLASTACPLACGTSGEVVCTIPMCSNLRSFWRDVPGEDGKGCKPFLKKNTEENCAHLGVEVKNNNDPMFAYETCSLCGKCNDPGIPVDCLLGSEAPSEVVSVEPSDVPSVPPSKNPSTTPSVAPSLVPSTEPSDIESDSPSAEPSDIESNSPSAIPTVVLSLSPSRSVPTPSPSDVPSSVPSLKPSAEPSLKPSSVPSLKPSSSPSAEPSVSLAPSSDPTETPICSDDTAWLYGGVSTQNCGWVFYDPQARCSLSSGGVDASYACPIACGLLRTQNCQTPECNNLRSFWKNEVGGKGCNTYLKNALLVQTRCGDLGLNLFTAPLADEPMFAYETCSQCLACIDLTVPSDRPSLAPSTVPFSEPSAMPSLAPSTIPFSEPSTVPFSEPSTVPSVVPSTGPTAFESAVPSSKPTETVIVPFAKPSSAPSLVISDKPSLLPSAAPSSAPSLKPSSAPSLKLSSSPSAEPSVSLAPSSDPTETPICSDDTTWLYGGVSTQNCGWVFYDPQARCSLSSGGVDASYACPIACGSLSTRNCHTPECNNLRSFWKHEVGGKGCNSYLKNALLVQTRCGDLGLNLFTAPLADEPMFAYETCSQCLACIDLTVPSDRPSLAPSTIPFSEPSAMPSLAPSTIPFSEPSTVPFSEPSTVPSVVPSTGPTAFESAVPSSKPTETVIVPFAKPSSAPSLVISDKPSLLPSAAPSSAPSLKPSSVPSLKPSITPSAEPSVLPSYFPSAVPTSTPICEDSETWIFNGDSRKNCGWVYRNPSLRCTKSDGVLLASEACPIACGSLRINNCVIPECNDDRDFWKTEIGGKGCLAHLRTGTLGKKCDDLGVRLADSDPTFAYETCSGCGSCVVPVVE